MSSLASVVTRSTIDFAKAHVRPVAAEIAARWVLYFIWGGPGRGTGDHAKGLALDFMGYDLGGGVNHPGPMRKQICNEIAAYVLANRVRLNVTYVIWNRRIASAKSNWAWRAYDGSNPHTDHVHVSFKATGTYHPPTPPEDDDMAANAQQIIDLLKAQNAERRAESDLRRREYLSVLTNVQQEDERDADERARDKQALDEARAEHKATLDRLAELEAKLDGLADNQKETP